MKDVSVPEQPPSVLLRRKVKRGKENSAQVTAVGPNKPTDVDSIPGGE